MDAAPRPRFRSIGRYSAAVGQDFVPHEHTEFELTYYTAGRTLVRVGAEEFEVTSGVLVVTRPHVVHSEVSLAGYANIFVGIDASPEIDWPLVAHDDVDGRILRVLEALMHENGRDGEMVDLLSRELDLLLRRAARSAAAPRPTAELVARAEFVMRRDLRDAPSLAELAHSLAVGASTLRAAFVTERGMPPRSRLAELRLDVALGLLRTSTLTLDNIARLAGYSSSSHLSREVKRSTGHSPGRVRELYR